MPLQEISEQLYKLALASRFFSPNCLRFLFEINSVHTVAFFYPLHKTISTSQKTSPQGHYNAICLCSPKVVALLIINSIEQ